MRDKITILQNQRDRLEERLSAVETAQQELLTQRQPKPERVTRKPLKVVVLEPDDESEAAAEPGDSAERGEPAQAGESTQPARVARPSEKPTQEGKSRQGRPLISGEGQQLTTDWVSEESP